LLGVKGLKIMASKSLRNGVSHVSISTDEREELIHVGQLGKMIECALILPYVKNEKPISVLIVAKPESGKTSVLKRYREKKGIVYMTDCTAYGIQRDLLPRLVSGEIRTLIIADLLTPLAKSYKTRESFIAFLNNLVEEGIAKITTYAMVWDKEAKANVITAITDQAIEDGRHDWAKLGFLSRFIVFSYSYDLSTVAKILNSYSIHGTKLNTVSFSLPKKDVDIQLSEEIAEKLNPIAVRIGEQFQIYGLRAKINLRSLIKCLAYRNNRRIVTELDFSELLELADYMNFKYNPLR
jgi:hypothetical protein